MRPTQWQAIYSAALAMLIGFALFPLRVEAKIVFTSKRDGDTDNHIYLMEDDGSNVRRLTDPAFYDTRPRWFPDGRKILFQRDHSRGNGAKENAEFLILDLKTGKAQPFMENHPSDTDPSISPDGKKSPFGVDAVVLRISM